MPGNPTECRRHAANCRKLAESAPTLDAKEAFVELALTWDRLAAELESAHVLLATMEQLDLAVPIKAEKGAKPAPGVSAGEPAPCFSSTTSTILTSVL